MMTFPIDPTNAGFVRDIFAKLEVPKATALVTTISSEGNVQGSLFCYFHIMYSFPPVCMFSIAENEQEGARQTLNGILSHKECVINLLDVDSCEKLSVSAPDSTHFRELDLLNLFSLNSSQQVNAPRLMDAPVQIECVVNHVIPFGKYEHCTNLVLAEAKRVHILKCEYSKLIDNVFLG